MDSISSEAISSLTAAINALIPTPADPALAASCLVNPLRISPTGVGGLAGMNEDPAGEIFGRRLEASVLVTAKAETADQLNVAVAGITHSIFTAEREALAKQGIRRIILEEIRPKSQTASNDGTKKINEQELSFKVLFEFLKVPQEASELISQLSFDVDVSTGGRMPVPLLRADFMQGSLGWFEVVDVPDPQNNKPSEWRYNPAESRIEQLSNIWGGSPLINPNKSGTYLVLKASQIRPAVRDFSFKTILQSDDARGIGVVFRWQDLNNYYFFLMDNINNYRLLAKRVDGAFQHMDTQAIDTEQSYQPGTAYQIKVKALGTRLELYMDNVLILHTQDESLPAPGRVGFMTHRNEKSYFYRIDLAQF